MKGWYLLGMLMMGYGKLNAQQAPLDVQHYEYQIALNDTSNRIEAVATIELKIVAAVQSFQLDLVAVGKDQKGMLVKNVTINGSNVSFSQQKETLTIDSPQKWEAGSLLTVAIQYAGIPANGLIISKNKFGNRTIFADNWPNRAHHWIPCVDHPSDKATVDFKVTAPLHYQVISNGKQVERTNLNHHTSYTHYKESIPIPTKVMVIGLADFAVQSSGQINCIPIETWVYPQDKTKGFYDYAIAGDILEWFQQKVGTYSYEKLANIQSTTMFGGMENAGAIFYGENTVTGDRKSEALLTHEIAHQWFGNAATEKSFEHLWLSEGFATCFTNLYLEQRYGTDTLKKRLTEERKEAIAFAREATAPIVNPTRDYMSLLNAFSYQKGGWVLHMLRRKLGDSLFWKGIRTYYSAYQNKNAATEDLQQIFEKTSGQSLSVFFHQWLYEKTHPVVGVEWHYATNNKAVQLKITQQQEVLFTFPLEIAFVNGKDTITKTLAIQEKETSYSFTLPFTPNQLIPDPNVQLFGETLVKKKEK